MLIRARQGGGTRLHRKRAIHERSGTMASHLADFDHRRVAVADGVSLHAAVGGSGPAVVLLHGFPQTHLMWRHVAADLALDHTVICPDLRGYGASDKPEEASEDTYSKRTMAADIIERAGT